jgi:hypothetical protein
LSAWKELLNSLDAVRLDLFVDFGGHPRG